MNKKNNKTIKISLEEIAERIKNGKNAESFSKELDILLGNEMTERDEELESNWNNFYKKSNG